MDEFQHRVAALAGCRTNESMGVVKINYLRMHVSKKLLHSNGTQLVHTV